MEGAKEGQLFVRIEQLALARESEGTTSGTYKVTCKVGQQVITTNIPLYGDFEPLVFVTDTLEDLYNEELRIDIFGDETIYSASVPRGSVTIPLKRLAINEEVDRWFEVQPPVIEHHLPGQMRLVLLLQGPYRNAFRWILRLYSSCLLFIAAMIEAWRTARRTHIFVGLLGLIMNAFLTPIMLLTKVTGSRDSMHTESEIAQTMHLRIVVLARQWTNRLLGKSVGQQLLYSTGKAPAVAKVVDAVVPASPYTRLLCAIVIDIIGVMSYVPPVVGESFDLVWAPMHAFALHCLFQDKHPTLQRLAFLEELCMFTDIIPSATLLWLACHQQYLMANIRRWLWQGIVTPDTASYPHNGAHFDQ